MFEELEFTYDRENHKGYIGQKFIPSVTQLLALRYPMGNVKQEILDKRSAYGTNVHQDIELYGDGLKDNCETQEGKNFILLTKALGLEVVKVEQQVLLKYNHKVVSYGTYDGLFRTTKYIVVDMETKKVFAVSEPKEGQLVLYRPNMILLYDIKTVSDFDNEKVGLQTSMYVLGENEMVDGVVGIWLREDKAQFRPLTLDCGNAYKTLGELTNEWELVYGSI